MLFRSNTGNGKIRVLSGYGQINVVNTTSYGVQVDRLDASQRGAGKLVILDTAKSLGLDSNGKIIPTSTIYNQNGAVGSYTYNPSDTLRYGWAVSWGTRPIDKHHEESSNWIGLINLGSVDFTSLAMRLSENPLRFTARSRSAWADPMMRMPRRVRSSARRIS